MRVATGTPSGGIGGFRHALNRKAPRDATGSRATRPLSCRTCRSRRSARRSCLPSAPCGKRLCPCTSSASGDRGGATAVQALAARLDDAGIVDKALADDALARAAARRKSMFFREKDAAVTGSITRPRLQANSGWFLLGRRTARSQTIMPERWPTACRLTTASLSMGLSNGAPTSRQEPTSLASAAEAPTELAGTSARTMNVFALRDEFAEDDASHARSFIEVAKDLRAMLSE